MKITYIHHSAFLVETESACLLFDYFEGTIPQIPDGKMLYVFASHRHPDHFSKVIFDLAAKRKNIIYLLSSDIWTKRVPEEIREKTHFLEPGTRWEDGRLTVETYKSTDEGAAFWCTVDGYAIYHAGDLNNWYWDGEEEKRNTGIAAAYWNEIQKMRGRTADIAFLPLDPRQEEYFYLGIDDFMKVVNVKKVFPMHFWGQFDTAARLKALPCSAAYRDHIVEIEKKGQEFQI